MKRYEAYKPVTSRWAKQLPFYWEFQKIAEVFIERKENNDPIKTTNILSLTNTRGIIPYSDKGNLGNKAKNDIRGYRLAYPGDIVLNSMNVVIGSVGLSQYYGAVSPVYYMLYVRDNAKYNVRYYNYVFRDKIFQGGLNGLGNGILEIRMRIPMSKLKYVCVPVPPRDEQDQIVRYLDWQVSKINRLIAAKRKQIGLISASKQAYISHLVTHGLNNSVKKKDSGIHWLGNIPAHWEVCKLRTILSPKSEKNRPDLPLLSVVREKGVILRDVEDKEANHNFIPDDLSGYKVVHANQFVINKMKAWQGSYGISPCDGIVSPAYFVFDINFENLEYFHYAIRSKVYVNFFAQASDGIRVGQWDLSVDKMKNIPFIIPPMEEQKEIVLQIKAQTVTVENACQKIQAQITALEALRTRLISDVVTGQIDVRGIEVPTFEYIDESNNNDENTEEMEAELDG